VPPWVYLIPAMIFFSLVHVQASYCASGGRREQR
jgi:ABC-type proline/glycine betaine transport system permease subunit